VPGENQETSVRFTLLAVALVATALNVVGCRSVAPNAGHEVVLVEKPLIFGHGGVDPEPVRTGRSFVAVTTDGIDVNMQPQKFEAELPDTMTSDGVPITFHAIMVLKVTNSVTLIRNFGPDWYQNNLEEPFRTMVRQAVRRRGMNETAISTTALDEIDREIQDQLVAFMRQKTLPVELVTMTVGRANPPDSVKNQRIETATQEQRIQTEKQTKLAEDQRQMAETSRANADNAYIVKQCICRLSSSYSSRQSKCSATSAAREARQPARSFKTARSRCTT
jgi:regulator of protease activity HflC (stomatin/prohibitin superfamily)